MRRSESGMGGNGLRTLLLISTLGLLSGCDWFDSTPTNPEKLRAGAEKGMSPSEALPPPPVNQQYGAADVAVNENAGGPAIGSIIAASGGQKAQIEKQEKEQAERDKADREAREKAAAANKAREEKYGGNEVIPVTLPAGAPANEPPTQPTAAPRTAVNGAPLPAPTPDATAPAAAPPAPSDQPSDPNASTKPAGM